MLHLEYVFYLSAMTEQQQQNKQSR